jgi:hypothetical protein
VWTKQQLAPIAYIIGAFGILISATVPMKSNERDICWIVTGLAWAFVILF